MEKLECLDILRNGEVSSSTVIKNCAQETSLQLGVARPAF